jgi:hypothetical protein
MSARKLTNGHMANVVKNARQPEASDPKKLERDQMRLYSFYKPSLQANDYIIEVTQKISSGTQRIEIKNTSADSLNNGLAPQEFEVIVPRFSLDHNIINSYYPPDGHQDESRILPHIVLNDPHYPWEIAPGITENLHSTIDMDPLAVLDGSDHAVNVNRSMVPWVALIVFDPDELQLTTIGEAQDLNLPGFNQPSDLRNQQANGTFSMAITDYFNKLPTSVRINYAAGFENDAAGFAKITGMTDKVDIIFPEKALVRQLFIDRGDNNTDTRHQDTATHKFGIEQYKYLAHVRHVNIEGCPDAGVEEEGLFSVVIASRTGGLRDRALVDGVWKELPSNLSQPRTQVCHLVSIEHLDSTLDLWKNPISGRVGLVSLFSWTYSALPPNPVDFVTTMRRLAEKQQMLRPDDTLLAKLEKTVNVDDVKPQASRVLTDRLKRGYTLARWRTQTGEETSAWTRGPLVPSKVPWPPAKTIADTSNTSQEYQILDPETGLMDLSYSSAWQLGKLLAISDTAFSSALMRFRSVVRNVSADKTRMKLNGMTPASDVIAKLQRSIAVIQGTSAGNAQSPQRVPLPSERSVVSDVTDITVLPIFKNALNDAVGANTGAGKDANNKPILYNGFNKDRPSNSDWPIIHDWIAEKLSLGGIPPQYIIPESSFVPLESLRFFYIDDFWLDCLIDGALSVANHLDKDDDMVRRLIKETFNTYLANDVPDAGFKPQIPGYGFMIRSKLIKSMPDLQITVKWNNPDGRFPVCRWTKWDDQTLMCLLDRQPEELQAITLSQPQHQQRYALGSHIEATAGKEAVTFVLRKLFTKGPGIAEKGNDISGPMTKTWLDFASRSVNTRLMARDINQQLQFGKPGDDTEYIDPTPNSCELGLELNDPSYYFQIVPPPGVDPTPQPRNRKLFVQDSEASSTREAMDLISRPANVKHAVILIEGIDPAVGLQKREAPTTTLGSAIQAPHKQALISPKQPTLNPSLSGHQSARVQSKFDLRIFPDYRRVPFRFPGPKEKYSAMDYVPTGNIYYFDLVFSIRKREKSTLKLLKIVFDIPVQPIKGKAPREPLIGADYDGPGVRMLSNQHFVPFILRDATQALLHIELVPRSATLDYTLPLGGNDTAELGFRLAECNISQIESITKVEIDGERKLQSRGKVLITWTEWYSTEADKDGEPVVNTYALIKQDITDDQEGD